MRKLSVNVNGHIRSSTSSQRWCEFKRRALALDFEGSSAQRLRCMQRGTGVRARGARSHPTEAVADSTRNSCRLCATTHVGEDTVRLASLYVPPESGEVCFETGGVPHHRAGHDRAGGHELRWTPAVDEQRRSGVHDSDHMDSDLSPS